MTAMVLMVPLAGSTVSDEVNWQLPDYVVMAALLFGAGTGLVLIARRLAVRYRLALLLITVTLVLYIWAELAVRILFSIGTQVLQFLTGPQQYFANLADGHPLY